MMRFVLAFAAVCALAGGAWAQSFGGASSGSLLGYRSSAGHYYNRSLSPAPRSPAVAKVAEARHANGLVVGVPDGFEAKPTEDGFTVEPAGTENLKVRYPVIASVSLAAGRTAPEEPGLKTKSLGRKAVRYRVTESEGGSGGAVYTLTVFERMPEGEARYAQAMQSKLAQPDFSLCWKLVGATRYAKPRRN